MSPLSTLPLASICRRLGLAAGAAALFCAVPTTSFADEWQYTEGVGWELVADDDLYDDELYDDDYGYNYVRDNSGWYDDDQNYYDSDWWDSTYEEYPHENDYDYGEEIETGEWDWHGWDDADEEGFWDW